MTDMLVKNRGRGNVLFYCGDMEVMSVQPALHQDQNRQFKSRHAMYYGSQAQKSIYAIRNGRSNPRTTHPEQKEQCYLMPHTTITQPASERSKDRDNTDTDNYRQEL